MIRQSSLAVAAATIALAGLAVVALSTPRGPATSNAAPAGRGATATIAPPSTTTTAAPTETTALAPPALATPTTAPPLALPPEPWKVMLIGDSMAFTAGLGLAPRAGEWGFVVANEGINGCGVVRGGPYRYFGAQRDMEARCDGWPAAWTDALARNQPQIVAIVIGRWELMDRWHDGRWTNLFDPAFAAYVDSEIDGAFALAASNGARVVAFTSPYYRRGTAPGGGLFPEDDPARVDTVNAIIRRVAERRQVSVIDVGRMLSPDGVYTRDVAGIRVRSDGVHLTQQTGQLLAPWLFPQLREVMTSPPPPPPVTASADEPGGPRDARAS